MGARIASEYWNPASSAAFLLGVCGVVLGLVPFIGILAIVPGLLAIPFGLAGRTAAREQDGFGDGRAITGLTLAVIAIILAGVQAFGWQAGGSDPDQTSAPKNHLFAPARVDPKCYEKKAQPLCSEMSGFMDFDVEPMSFRRLETPTITVLRDNRLRYTTHFIARHETVDSLRGGYEFSFDPPEQFQPPSYEHLGRTREGEWRVLRFKVHDRADYLLVIRMRRSAPERVEVKATMTTITAVGDRDQKNA